jgi:hypothetical protein
MKLAQYKLLMSEDDEPMRVSIDYDDSPYKGVVFEYKTVSVKNTVFGNVKVKFDYNILEDPQKIVENFDLDSKIQFEQFLGEILLDLVVETSELRGKTTIEN